jgi:DNA-binding NarL/FixJ family response regulator
MIQVLLTDDHHLFREGLARILKDAPNIELVGCATSGEEAIELMKIQNPDVVMMDINMPGMGGLEAARRIHISHPDTRILMLTISEQEDDLFTAVRIGARGYILKNSTSKELLDGIRQVYEGEAPITPTMAAKLMNEFATLSTTTLQTSQDDQVSDTLTQREDEVLRLVARGLSNKEIGSELSISPLTVKAHLSSILEKLHLRGRVEAAAWAIRHGLLGNE